MPKKAQLLGKVFGRLTVTGLVGRSEDKMHLLWSCLCLCGKEVTATSKNLNRGTKSCGCLVKDTVIAKNIKHKMSGTKTYGIWVSMLNRCRDANVVSYPRYGGRGIVVCDRWLKFENFLADMGEKPRGKSLERRDNNEGYSTRNCYWATYVEQNNNRRSNVHVKIVATGQTMTVAQASRLLRVPYELLRVGVHKNSFVGVELCP